MPPQQPYPLPPADAQRMHAAVAAWQRGDVASAQTGFHELAARHPRFADARHFLGLLRYQQGEHKQALAMLDEARRLAPDNVNFLRNHGRILRETGYHLGSVTRLRRARELDQDHLPTLISLAQSLICLNCAGEVVAELERCLETARDDWRLWMLLGYCREQGGDREGAMAAYAEGSRLAPPNEPTARIAYAQAASRNARPGLAEREFLAALALDPTAADAELGLAHLAAAKGDFAEAERLLESTLAHDPSRYGAWTELAQLQPGSGALAERLDAVIAGSGDDDLLAWPLYFARARVRETLGDYDHAFADYQCGNRLRERAHPDVPLVRTEYTRDIIASLDRDFVNRSLARSSPDRPGVIFICGMPRSGTTLIETILAAHPEVRAGGEQLHIHDRIRRELGRAKVARTGSWLRARSDDELRELARGWQTSLAGSGAEHTWVTDKLPSNYSLLGLIQVCFPDAPIVHVRRDARDTCFSCFATPFTVGHEFSHTLAGSGRAWRLYASLMRHWRETLEPGRIVEIEYEALVRQPEAEIRRLLAALGLDWDERCLAFHRLAREVNTASLYQVRRPLYADSIGRWRHFERHLGPLIEALDAPSRDD